MRKYSRRGHTRYRESGGFWLSFSDMMSVLVLVFIFVIFSMMLSLSKQKEQLEKTENQYAEAMARMEESEQALTEKEGLLADSEAQLQVLTEELEGKTVILAQREKELAEQAQLIADQQTAIEQTIVVLTNEKAELDGKLSAAEEKLSLLSNTEEELSASRTIIVDLQNQLLSAQNEASVLRAASESQTEQIVILGRENAQLLKNAESAQSDLTAAQEENARLSQRISMLNGNADAKQAEIDRLLKLIEEREKELDALGVEYNALMRIATDTQNALSSAESVMQTQSKQLSEYEDSLADYRAELLRTQGQLEQMVGVKAQIVQSLSSALRKSGIDVSVDEQTGAIALPSEMLFDDASNELSRAGRNYLDRFLPVYLNVLLSDDFKPYIAEIIIEGHTDSRGAYLYNLNLSQKRALSVANYVLEDRSMSGTLKLTDENALALRTLITASGRSFSAPVLDGNGREDQDASRRVEIKFRLKDDETVALTEQLLEIMGSNG